MIYRESVQLGGRFTHYRSAVRCRKFGGQSYYCPSWAGQNRVPLGGDYDLLGPFPGRTASIRTWYGLRTMDLYRRWSAIIARFSKDGWSAGRYPLRLSLATSLSSLILSAAEVNPHHAGDAYSREAMVVILATICGCLGWRPRDLSILRA